MFRTDKWEKNTPHRDQVKAWCDDVVELRNASLVTLSR